MSRSVVFCPNDPNDINKATMKLGCGKDIYNNSQYICLPNQQKTELEEFCYQGTMEMFEEGNCLETSEGKLIRQSCIQFFGGCPMHPFRSSEILKYPACQAINKHLNCYSLDPSCQPQKGKELPIMQELPIILGVIILVLVVVIISIVLFIYFKRRKRRRKIKYTLGLSQRKHEEQALVDKQVKEALTDKQVLEDGGKQFGSSTQGYMADSGKQFGSSTQGDMAGSKRSGRSSTLESISGSTNSEYVRIFIDTNIQSPVRGIASNTLPITIIQGNLIEPEKNKVFNTFPKKSEQAETTL